MIYFGVNYYFSMQVEYYLTYINKSDDCTCVLSERKRSNRPVWPVKCPADLLTYLQKAVMNGVMPQAVGETEKRGSWMRRVWPVMDCVIIRPWRCRSLERNGLLCLLLLCQCNHSESRCYKSPAQHSCYWNSRTGWDEMCVCRNTLCWPGAVDWEERLAC